MSKKKHKKEPRGYIICGDKKFCIEEITEAVNSYDKSFGLKLKHPDVWADPVNYRGIVEAKADMNIAAMLCIVNGVELDDYFVTDTSENGYGTVCKPVGIMHVEFTDKSILNWTDQKTMYDINSMTFRCRYLTLVLMNMIGRMDKMTDQEVQGRRRFRFHSIDEQRIVLTKEILNDTVRFINTVATPYTQYQNIILKMHEHVSYGRRKPNHRELRNLLNGHVLQTRRSMQPADLLTERFAEDDMTIYNVLKIAYMLATNKTNLKVIPNFGYIEHATKKHDLRKLVEELGAQIIQNTNGKKYAPMFKAFVEARPRVYTQFYKSCENNMAMRVGVLALGYTSFVFDDKTMKRFINEMLRKGI